MDVQLRSMLPNDVDAIIDVHKKSIYALCKDFYTVEQIEIWTSMFNSKIFNEGMKNPNNIGLVAVKDDKIVGYGFFNNQDKEVKGIYLIPDVAHKGVGYKILSKLESIAKEYGLDEFVLNSTLNAVAFYEKCGFRKICDELFELTDDCTLPCVHMNKKLY